MKSLLNISLLFLLPFSVFSQTDTTGVASDSTRVEGERTTIKIGKTTVIIVEQGDDSTDVNVFGCDADEPETKRERSKDFTHWTGIDLGINSFSFGPDPINLESGDYDMFALETGRSRSIAFNIYEEKLRIAGDYFGVFTGLGFEINNYSLKNDYTLHSNKDTVFAVMDSTIRLSKNKFRTTWVNVPLMVEFNTSKYEDKNFHLAAGVVGGWRLGTKYKQKFKRNGFRERSKTNRDFHVMDYKLDATVRLGYRDFTLFASYSLTPLFVDGKTTEIHPFSVGIQLVSF